MPWQWRMRERTYSHLRYQSNTLPDATHEIEAVANASASSCDVSSTESVSQIVRYRLSSSSARLHDPGQVTLRSCTKSPTTKNGGRAFTNIVNRRWPRQSRGSTEESHRHEDTRPLTGSSGVNVHGACYCIAAAAAGSWKNRQYGKIIQYVDSTGRDLPSTAAHSASYAAHPRPLWRRWLPRTLASGRSPAQAFT